MKIHNFLEKYKGRVIPLSNTNYEKERERDG